MKRQTANITETLRAEQGYVLVAALVTLLLLTVLGIWATRTTNVELRVAANERLHQRAFYQADSGDALAERLIYHNMLCVNAVDETDPSKPLAGFAQEKMPAPLFFEDDKLLIFDLPEINSPGEGDYDDSGDPGSDEPSDKNRTFLYCPGAKKKGACDGANPPQPRTNVLIGSKMAAKKGQGLIQSSGYEGFGVGAANVGFYWTYKIRSQHLGGVSDNESRVNVIWQLSGLNVSQSREEDCHYGKHSQRVVNNNTQP